MFGQRFTRRFPTTTSSTTTTAMSTTSSTTSVESHSTLPPTAVPSREHQNNNIEENRQLVISIVRDQIGERFLRFLNDKFGHETGDNNNESENEEQFSASEVVLAVGGALVCLHFTNKAITTVYYHAVSHIDRAARDPQRRSWRTSFWFWTERVLKRVWLPLWFTHERIQISAIRNNLEDAYPRRRIQQIRALGQPNNSWVVPIYNNITPAPVNNTVDQSSDNNNITGQTYNVGPGGRRPIIRNNENR